MRQRKIFGKVIGIALVCLVIGAMLPISSFASQSQAIAQQAKTWYVDDDLADYPDADFTKIQDAVDAASPGDTIIVYPGTYTENVDVNKDHLTIQSENGAGTTIVQAADPNDHVFEVTADHVAISGFTVKGATKHPHAGIYLRNVEDCNIFDNIASNNLYGIYLDHSSNNTISGNSASLNEWRGIFIWFCSGNTLSANTVSSNKQDGIQIGYSSNNILSGNVISGNPYNFYVWGNRLSHYIQNIDASNKVDGKPIQYLVDQRDLVIDSSWDLGYLGIVNCTNMVVKDLTLTNSGQGVLLAYSSDSRIQNVTSLNNYNGICLHYSSNNILSGNRASLNKQHGIELWGSSNNTLTNNDVSNNNFGIFFEFGSNNNIIYLNNFVDNQKNAYPHDESTNTWNSPEEITYTYDGKTYTSYLGNYWDDYAEQYLEPQKSYGGIWDSPYSVNSDADNYPLVGPFENYEIGPPTLPSQAAELAIGVIDADYVWSAQGWNWDPETKMWLWENGRFLEADEIKEGYYYYDYETKEIKFGKGLDCSGLVFWAYNKAYGAKEYSARENPIFYNYSASQQYWANCEPIEKEDLLPGDLLFFNTPYPGNPDHVAIYVGPATGGRTYNVVHASYFAGKVMGAFYDPNTEELTTVKPETGEVQTLRVTYYGRVIDHNKKGMKCIATSPIDLNIADPDGIVLTKEVGEVAGMFYAEWDVNGDGELDDIIAVPQRKIGDYLITVAPELGASPTDIYTLEVWAEDVTIVLAENVQISDIPSEGYIVRSTETEIVQIVPATFQINHAKIDFKKKPDDDKVRVQGKLELDLVNGDGVDISEGVTVIVGPLSETIMIVEKGKKDEKWKYKRPKGGEGNIKHMTINWKNGKFDIRMDKADLTGVTNPVTISIQIGDDFGEETILMREKKHHWDYKAK